MQVVQEQVQVVQQLTLPLDEEEELPGVVGGADDPLGGQAPGGQGYSMANMLRQDLAGVETTPRTIKLSLGNLYNNYVPCKAPRLVVILVLGFLLLLRLLLSTRLGLPLLPSLALVILALVKIEQKQHPLFTSMKQGKTKINITPSGAIPSWLYHQLSFLPMG